MVVVCSTFYLVMGIVPCLHEKPLCLQANDRVGKDSAVKIDCTAPFLRSELLPFDTFGMSLDAAGRRATLRSASASSQKSADEEEELALEVLPASNDDAALPVHMRRLHIHQDPEQASGETQALADLQARFEDLEVRYKQDLQGLKTKQARLQAAIKEENLREQETHVWAPTKGKLS